MLLLKLRYMFDLQIMENPEQPHEEEHGVNKESCIALIKEGISSPDLSMVSMVEVIVNGCLYDRNSPFYGLLSVSELSCIVVDASFNVSSGTHGVYFESIGEMVSGNLLFGRVIRRIAERKIYAKGNTSLEGSTDDDVLTLLREFAMSESLSSEDVLFSELIHRIKYTGDRLPSFYYDMIDFINGSVLSYEQRDYLLAEIYKQFEGMGYVDALVPVVFDILRLSLGPVDKVRLPSSTTNSVLISIEEIIRAHIDHMFIPGSYLNIFKAYINNIHEYIKHLTPSGLQEDEGINEALSDDKKKLINNFQSILDSLHRILSSISSANIITY